MAARKRKQYEPKTTNRKYSIVVFWNTLAGISIVSQQILNVLLKDLAVKLPLEIIIGIAGVLSAAYLGVNLAEKKITGLQGAKDMLGIPPSTSASAPAEPKVQ